MRRAPHRVLPITPQLLKQLCKLCDSAGPLGPSMKAAFTLMFFGMLRQSNIAPATAASFDPTRHTARGDIIPSPPGLVVIAKWTKTIQTMDNVPVLPVPKVPGSPADPVAAYRALLKDFPSRHPNQPLLGYLHQGCRVVVTIAMLSSAPQRATHSSGPRLFTLFPAQLQEGVCYHILQSRSGCPRH